MSLTPAYLRCSRSAIFESKAMSSVTRSIAVCVVLAASNSALAASPVPRDGNINEAGEWYLENDWVGTDKFSVRINASGVTLDLAERTIRCNPEAPETAVTYGVFAAEVENTTIRNGKITGCFMGIHAASATETTIELVDFTGNTYIGANLGGSDNRITESIFADISGYSAKAYSIGINNPGSDCLIARNVFRNLYRQPGAEPSARGEGVAILHSAGTSGCVDRHNWIENDRLGTDIAIWIAVNSNAEVTENSISGFGRAVISMGDGGVEISDNRLWLSDAVPDSYAIVGNAGQARGNLIINFETPFSGSIERDENTVYGEPGTAELPDR